MATATLDKTKSRPVQARRLLLSWHSVRVILKTSVIYILLIAGALFFLFPLAWMAGTSLKTAEEVGQSQLSLVPDKAQWQNYERYLSCIYDEETQKETCAVRDDFMRAYVNSVFVTTMVLLGTVTSISLVAYAFARMEWRGRNLVFALMMGTLMLPVQATLVPQYVLFFELDWIRTFDPITIPGYFAGGATLIFLMRQFMLGIPKELDEAAMIDGANPLQIWWFVIMPLCRPAVATISLFIFIGNWNNLLQPAIYLQRRQLYTMPVYIRNELFNLQEIPIPWQNIMAASTLFVIPVLVIFILTQRYFTEGIAFTGLKG